MENQTTISASETTHRLGNVDDHEYDAYLARVRARFDTMTKSGTVPLFTTDAEGLWEAYLDAFPAEQRQFHSCNSCKAFILRFGGLVVISEGVTGSAIWNVHDAPELYRASVDAMVRVTRRAKVTGVFLSSLPAWGQAETGIWRHFSLVPFRSQVFANALLNAGQVMASKHEDFNTVSRALAEFSPTTVEQALTLLKSDVLYRSEKVLGQAQWLHELHEARAAAGKHDGRRDNVTWERIATAPAGFCHPRSSMIGTLLEDIEAGLPFADVSRKFRAKLAPDVYQRPQAAPTAGNIAAAEKIVEKLGIARSLERRFARLDEIQTIWRPVPKADPEVVGAVFGHLTPKDVNPPVPPMVLPEQVITWERFEATVLHDAASIELMAPYSGNYCAIVTATHADAPPILQWDTLEQRNPFSTYTYANGSLATGWALQPNNWVRVNAVSAMPQHWFGGDPKHHAPGAFFILEGAHDRMTPDLALFPEILKAELHAVRATIEAHSKSGKLTGEDQATACGYVIGKGTIGLRVRVTLANGSLFPYRIDRWQ